MTTTAEAEITVVSDSAFYPGIERFIFVLLVQAKLCLICWEEIGRWR